MYEASIPDLLRLFAVPVFAWAAVRDLRTRRVPNRAWLPLFALGVLLLAWEAWTVFTGPALPYRERLFAVRVGVSVGVVMSLAYLLWAARAFGGADAKAFMAVALLFPTYPTYHVAGTTLPLVETTLGVFSLTVLTNTVLAGLAYPFALAARNLAAGRVGWVAFVGVPVAWDDVPETHGRLLEAGDGGGFTRGGLDLDALRMYLRWRDADLAALRSNPDLRDPATLPAEPRDPTDGAVATDGGHDDPWGAAAFLDSLDGDAYGTDPETLRAGLDLLVDREEVWVSPGIPFVVPTFLGLCVALTYGDLSAVVLRAVGLAA
ncbi:MAG: prepilin peptidase [Halobacteriaceae archaeon]